VYNNIQISNKCTFIASFETLHVIPRNSRSSLIGVDFSPLVSYQMHVVSDQRWFIITDNDGVEINEAPPSLLELVSTVSVVSSPPPMSGNLQTGEI